MAGVRLHCQTLPGVSCWPVLGIIYRGVGHPYKGDEGHSCLSEMANNDVHALFLLVLLPNTFTVNNSPLCRQILCRSISPDAVYRKTRAVLTAAGETFLAHGVMVSRPGFTTIMPWKVCFKS
jgi:hypothetical protein